MPSKLRIIGGEWRSRQIIFEDSPGLRPTPARVRETLFNWLRQDVIASKCLDLFAGSGALGLEAASRGAQSVLQVDNNAQVCRNLKANCDKLSAQQIKVVQQDVFRFLAGDAQKHDLVFLDPPFGQGLVGTTCRWLEDKEWLAAQAKIYVEKEKNGLLDDVPEHWTELKHKTAGNVEYYLFARQ